MTFQKTLRIILAGIMLLGVASLQARSVKKQGSHQFIVNNFTGKTMYLRVEARKYGFLGNKKDSSILTYEIVPGRNHVYGDKNGDWTYFADGTFARLSFDRAAGASAEQNKFINIPFNSENRSDIDGNKKINNAFIIDEGQGKYLEISRMPSATKYQRAVFGGGSHFSYEIVISEE